jgi:exosome complex component RRP41
MTEVPFSSRQLVSSSGVLGALAASINAVTLALIDAGIAMVDYVCALTTGLVEDQVMFDLNYYEENAAYDCPKFTVASCPRSSKVLLVHLESRMQIEKFNTMKDEAIKASLKLFSILDEVIRKRTV